MTFLSDFFLFLGLALAFLKGLCTVRLFGVYILFKKLNDLKVLAFVMNLWDYQLMNSKRIMYLVFALYSKLLFFMF